MAQICGKCSHVNPADASYCYFDGAILGDPRANGGPINAGSRPFPSQFVFPSGTTCRNFDQLAMACQQNWPSAVDLLRQGYLATFLGGLGRADLALAAQESARFPDHERGLDQLLAKLPSQVLEAPKLQVEPTSVNLGVLNVGTDRTFELHLANQGMRLLYGSVVSDCKWLTLGEAPGNAQKLFQFGNDAVVHVHVRGQFLRAGNKPLEGRLIVESNGGTATVVIRVDVPMKAFTAGVLAGALTPRQIAEKAKAAPKDAAILFENGAVARWFTANGWTYPVQGPSASGIGAVQQFFEALGLASAPKVEITEKALQLRGDVGYTLQATLEVKTPEKRPVYAHATCDQPWLDVSRTILSGRIANVVVLVPHVPNRAGETLQARVTVTANGNQKFVVPVSLAVTGNPSPYYPEFAPEPAVQAIPALPTFPALTASEPMVFAVPISTPGSGSEPVVTAMPIDQGSPFAVAQPNDLAFGTPGAGAWSDSAPMLPMEVGARRVRRQQGGGAFVHGTPLLVLLLALVGVIVKDLFAPAAGDSNIDLDPVPRVTVQFDTTMRWGLVAQDPKNPGNFKKLTYDSHGITNSLVVSIDGKPRRFGVDNGRWQPKSENVGKTGKKSVWQFDDGIYVTQIVDIVSGEPVEIGPDRYQLRLDTCLVRYEIENKDNRPRRVGLRMLLDTLIGGNDGAPFTVPGIDGLVGKESFRDFQSPKTAVPDFIQVLENQDLKNPGVIAQLNLRLGGKLEEPTRVSLTHWPNDHYFRPWEVPLRPLEKDSAIAIYWNERQIGAGDVRPMGFSYGLGNVSGLGGQLGVTVGGVFGPGGELTVVALTPHSGQTLTLKLPPGFTLVEGQEKQEVRAGVAGRLNPVTWRVRSSNPGNFTIEVHSSTPGVAAQKKRVTIRTSSLF
jgi:hypothetical protein